MYRETVHSSTALELGAAILQQIPRDISQEVALGWIGNKKALGKVLRDALVASSLLELMCTTDVSAQEVFKAVDFFKENSQPDAIKVWPNITFRDRFVRGSGKIELDVPATTLNTYILREASVDHAILVALGGSSLAQTYLSSVAQLIKAQDKGQEGVLLTNGWDNIFYVKDANGELLVVYCSWCFSTKQWVVDADLFTNRHWWNVSDRIFSPAVLVP